MQPTIICTAATAGMIYLNGRFAGEASRERPLFAPVAPSGAVYIEYKPLEGEGGVARRLVFSGGAPLAESLAGAEGLSCVAWPGGAAEVELTVPRQSAESCAIEGMPALILRGEEDVLTLNGAQVPVPPGAGVPRLLRLPDAIALLGDVAGGGQYLATLDPGLTAATGLLVADAIEPSEGGMFTAIVSLGDSVGHGRLEQWLADGGGLTRLSSQSTWSRGAPRWPDTAEGAMIAAVEAALAGLGGEAENYLSPTLAANRPLEAIGEICEVCVPMKYAAPDARPCVGLLKTVNDHLATVRPLYYRAEPIGGVQGPWQIYSISLE